MSVCFCPYGKQVASGSKDNSIKIWDTNTGACESTLSGHSRYFDCCLLLLLFSNVWCMLTIEHFTGMS